MEYGDAVYITFIPNTEHEVPSSCLLGNPVLAGHVIAFDYEGGRVGFGEVGPCVEVPRTPMSAEMTPSPEEGDWSSSEGGAGGNRLFGYVGGLFTTCACACLARALRRRSRSVGPRTATVAEPDVPLALETGKVAEGHSEE